MEGRAVIIGLDMYLEAEKYVSGYDFYKDAEVRKAEYQRVLDSVDAASFVDASVPSATVRVGVAYWRKANAIHAWFVNELADGKDECQDIYVPREKLTELLDLVDAALTEPEQAANFLPTQGGFFFGSTDYDEWYIENLKETKEMVERVLRDVPDDWEFNYRASW